MDTYIVMLWPQGSHLGPLTAQTLFGGVCWALETLGVVDVGTMLAGFEQQPRFVFSSPFPFVVKDNPAGHIIRLYPKPALPSITMKQVQALAEQKANAQQGPVFKKAVKQILAKQVKPVQKVAYVSEQLFAQICAGEWDGFKLVEKICAEGNSGGTLCAEKGALWSKDEYAAVFCQKDDSRPSTQRKKDVLWQTDDVQRNAVDRLLGSTAEGQLFHEAQTFYRRDRAGLWFAARADAEAWGWLQAAFRYLQDTGLGGKRTVGKGHFEFKVLSSKNALPVVTQADSFITLSPYLPRFNDEKIEAKPVRYTLRTVRQKAENKFPGATQPVYSGGVRLFEPGSVFAAPMGKPAPEIYGRLAKLGEVNGRTVYYNGLALSVPIRLGGRK
jgi:CRISPR type III-A-associated RAMP protein Csm4